MNEQSTKNYNYFDKEFQFAKTYKKEIIQKYIYKII